MKKTLIIILIFAAIIAVGTGVYFAWKKSQEILTPPSVSVPVETQNQSTEAEQPSGKLKAVSSGESSAYWIYKSASSSEIYYFDSEGFLFKEKSGGDEKILKEAISGIKSLTSDKDGKSVAVESDGGFVILAIGASGIIKESIKDAVSVSFSPTSDKMAYFTASGDLNVRDYSPKLKSPKVSKIINLNFEDAVIKWISGDKIILNSRPSAYYSSEAWLVDLSKKTAASFAKARGLYFNWSLDGKTAVRFSVDASLNPFLSLINSSNSALANFEFLSLPEKCFIGTERIYCAIPQSNNLSGRLVLPDDYLKKKVYFNDYIYEIGAKDGSINLVYSENKNGIDAFNLTVIGNRVLFINRYDNKLYDLELL
jgi:hypothetical protein